MKLSLLRLHYSGQKTPRSPRVGASPSNAASRQQISRKYLEYRTPWNTYTSLPNEQLPPKRISMRLKATPNEPINRPNSSITDHSRSDDRESNKQTSKVINIENLKHVEERTVTSSEPVNSPNQHSLQPKSIASRTTKKRLRVRRL
jgi:hypothetical protein